MEFGPVLLQGPGYVVPGAVQVCCRVTCSKPPCPSVVTLDLGCGPVMLIPLHWQVNESEERVAR